MAAPKLKRTLVNKYPAKCPVCQQWIEIGAEIFPHGFLTGKRGGIVPVHLTCETEYDALYGTPDERTQEATDRKSVV